MTKPYALSRDQGWTGDFGPNFIVKARETGTTNGLAFVEYVTVSGEEPGDHTHPTEDEIFYVIDGEVSFRCGEERFDTESGGFVFLPRGIQHGYTIRSETPVRMLVITAPPRDNPDGWGGLMGSILPRD